MQAVLNAYRHYFCGSGQVKQIKDTENHLFNVPLDVIILIFSHLNAYDLMQMGRTCHAFHQLSQDKVLDVAKLHLFKKMRTKRIGEAPENLAFFLDGNRLICGDKRDDHHIYEIRDLKQKKTELVVPVGGLHSGELKDYFFFIFFDESLRIKFISKDDYKLETTFELSKYNIALREFRAYENTLVIQIGKHLICIKNGNRSFTIDPIDFDDSTYDVINDFEPNNEYLLVSRTISTRCGDHNLHQLFHLFTEQLIARATFPQKTKDLAISYNFVTPRYITTLNGLEHSHAYVHVTVYDLTLKVLRKFKINEFPQFHFGDERYYGAEYFYCYENRMIAFLNHTTLLFFDLDNGRLIKRCLLGPGQNTPLDPLDVTRISACGDKVVATKSKSIELFDIHTGNVLHRFQTAYHPIWINLTRGYKLHYSIYDKKKRNYYLAHLIIPDQNKRVKTIK